MQEAARQHAQTGKPARVFTEFDYQTTSGSWSRARRIVSKCEQIEGKENPRYVVTDLSPEHWSAQPLYEELYCQRGDMETRIKEQFSLFAGRVSAETISANDQSLTANRDAPLRIPKQESKHKSRHTRLNIGGVPSLGQDVLAAGDW